MAIGPLLPDIAQVISDVTDFEDSTPDAPIEYGKSLLFNFGPDGDIGFQYSQANKVTVVDDYRSLLTWIDKALRTPRGIYEIYGPDYGTDLAAQMGQLTPNDYIGHGSDDVTRCLLVHPLIEDVTDIMFVPTIEPDTLILQFTVVDRITGPLEIVVNF